MGDEPSVDQNTKQLSTNKKLQNLNPYFFVGHCSYSKIQQLVLTVC